MTERSELQLEETFLPEVHEQSSQRYENKYDLRTNNRSHAENTDRQLVTMKPQHVPLPRLVCLNMLVSGIELCASVGFTYTPPMLLKAGFSETSMTCLMGIGPFLALLTVPHLGHWSDKCESRFGRRRPFIFAVSMLIILALVLISHGGRTIFMAIGVILLDFSCHAGFNPCEALISDTMAEVVVKDQGFIVYSSMVSIGGCVGYLITAVDWSGLGVSRFLGGQEQAAFCVLLVLFIMMLSITLVTANEKPLRSNVPKTTAHGLPSTLENAEDVGYETDVEDPLDTTAPEINVITPVQNTAPHLSLAKSWWRRCWTRPFSKTIFRVAMDVLWRKCGRIACLYGQVPFVLKRLFVADLCSWTALMCHNMFYTDYVAQAIYRGNPSDADGSFGRELYDEGVRMGSWGLLAHSATAIIYTSLVQKTVMQIYGMNRAYFFGLLTFAICMICTMLTSNLVVVNVFAAISGLGFAAATTIPYMLVTAYHVNRDLYFGHIDDKMSNRVENVEPRGFGADIALLDSACILSQIFLSIVVGEIVKLTDSVTAYIAISAFFAFMACYFSRQVVFTPSDMVVARTKT